MRVLEVFVRDFRNIAAAALAPSPRATVLVGANGQGKTNLLEAVYLACTLRPLRATRLAELPRFGTELAEVALRVEGPGGERRVAVEVRAGGRTATLDGKPQERLDAYFEGLAAVCFAPDDLLLVKGGPEARRRFLDRAAFNRWPAVLSEVREYLRALRSRNAALRTAGVEVEESFRAPLVAAGARLLRRRLDLLGELSPRVAVAHAAIAGLAAAPAAVTYRAAGGLAAAPGDREERLAPRLAALLEERTARDRDRGFTSVGPHMDDLALELGGRGAQALRQPGPAARHRPRAQGGRDREPPRGAGAATAPPARRRLVGARPREERLPPRLPPRAARTGHPHHHRPAAPGGGGGARCRLLRRGVRQLPSPVTAHLRVAGGASVC